MPRFSHIPIADATPANGGYKSLIYKCLHNYSCDTRESGAARFSYHNHYE